MKKVEIRLIIADDDDAIDLVRILAKYDYDITITSHYPCGKIIYVECDGEDIKEDQND